MLMLININAGQKSFAIVEIWCHFEKATIGGSLFVRSHLKTVCLRWQSAECPDIIAFVSNY